MRPRLVLATALTAMVVLTLVSAGLALVALNAGGEARLGEVAAMKIAAGYDRRAERLLSAPARTPQDRREAARLSAAALAQFPYDTSAWLRLAYVDSIENGGLSPDGAALLRRSYELVPVDIYVGVWRVGFALENSQALPRDVRAMARNEVNALWRSQGRRGELKAMLPRIRNPAGRLSLALWLDRLEARVAK